MGRTDIISRRHGLIPKVGQYCRGVLSGAVPAGEAVRLAIRRHLADLKNGASRGLIFDQESAAYAIEFFEAFLALGEGNFEGKPFLLSPFQQFIIASLFGWKTRDGYRRFRTAYVEIGKGNGKSPLAAGIGLFGLVADGEAGAEIYSAATVKDQAKILFRDAERMVDASPHLKELVKNHVNNLSCGESFFRPISSEKRGLDGKRVHMALVDEVHEHASAIVVDKMRAGTKGRRQALIFEITNSGHDRNTVCYQHHEYSLKVLQGILEDDSWFAYICQLDVCAECKAEGKTMPSCEKCDQWTDPAVWIKANPNLGVSIQPKYLVEQVREAQGMPSKENIVKRLNFCIWTEQAVRWMPMDAWDECGREPVDPEALSGHRCFAAFDLSSTSDLASFVAVFPDDGNAVISLNWIPEKNMALRIKRDRVPYDLWQKQGLLKATQGNVIDFRAIRKDIQGFGQKYQVQEIRYDPWNAAQIAIELQEEDGFKMVQHRQGTASMTAPTKSLEAKVLRGDLRHGGNPLMRWCASNVAVSTDPAGNIKPDKERSTEKIDPIVALIMANGSADANPDAGYTDPEVMVV